MLGGLGGARRFRPVRRSAAVSATSSPTCSAVACRAGRGCGTRRRARRAPGGGPRPRSRDRGGTQLRRGGEGRAGAARGLDLDAVPDLPWDRRQARHLADRVPGLRRSRDRESEPGDLLDLPAVLQLPRVRNGDRGSRAPPATAPALSATSAGCGSTSRRGSETAAGSNSPEGGGRACAAGRRATCT